MKKHYSIIIIGAGSVGMATGYYLAKQKIDTLLIDAFDPPHHKGSHHGETRLIRHATGEGGQYVDLALRAQTLWHQLEEETGQTLFVPSGILMAGEKHSPFIQKTVKSANDHGLSLEKMTGSEIKKRWPGFSIPDHFVGYFESSSGALFSEKCIQVYKEQILQKNITLKTNTKVTSINFSNKGVVINTANDTFYADKLVVSAGAWTSKILNSLDLPLQPMRKTLGWFAPISKSYSYPNLPCFYFSFEDQKYYGFPSINGNGVKVGRNDSEREIDPDLMTQDFGKYESDEGDLRTFLKRFLPGSAGHLIKGNSCMITKTPDKDFIVDYHPEYPHVLIAGGFSGHGFKYSSVLGEILSQLLKDGYTHHDVSKFSLSRPILTTED